MKKRIIIINILIFIFITMVIVFKSIIQPYIVKKSFDKNILLFLNDNNKSNITNYSKWIKYAKSEKNEEYDISGIINDYINAVDLAIQKRINNNITIRYDEYYKSGGLDIVAEHGVKDNWIEYIAKNITKEDIDLYNANQFFDKLIAKIEKVFIHKSNKRDKDWYIKNDRDKVIELPYNVYYTFVCDHKKLKKEVKEIMSVNTKEISKHYTICKVKYKNYNNEIKEEEIKMFNDVNMYTGEKTYFYNDFKDLYYTDGNMPTLTAGQHDYDEAREEQRRNSNFTPLPSSDDIVAWEKELEKIEAEKRRVFEEESRKYSK